MSSRIAVLPSHVADQIAAGEVVERPASVVKELVENAMDAGATAIDVTIMDGGRALIRVSDDGHGMGSDDAVLAISRHATSKIRLASDLVGVASFGFRGEALPAIGSVSTLSIETAESDGDATTVRVTNGMLTDVIPSTRRRGTTVQVEGLFAQVPARRKFLRAARTEWCVRACGSPRRTTESRSSRWHRRGRCANACRRCGAMISRRRWSPSMTCADRSACTVSSRSPVTSGPMRGGCC
jgi:DNA mismatch repair protein MutL